MITIELRAYQDFLKKFGNKNFGRKRMGQAFYDHFKLYKMTEQGIPDQIYEADNEEAVNLIRSYVEFN